MQQPREYVRHVFRLFNLLICKGFYIFHGSVCADLYRAQPLCVNAACGLITVMPQEKSMFGLFKKKSKPEIVRGTEAPVAPFEILLPEELTKGQIPDLRIGSKVLDILRVNSNDVHTLEVFEGMPVVNSNNAQLKEFVTVVNGAKQTSVLKEQIGLMCFPPQHPDSLGVLCCLVNGVLHEFHVANRGGGATLNYQFTKVVHAKA